MIIEPSKPDRKQLREFGVVIGIGFTTVFYVLLPWLRGYGRPAWPLVSAALLWLLAAAAPRILAPLFRVWMKIGSTLGWVNARIILGLLFFIIITPVGLVGRILGKQFIEVRFEPDSESYRKASTSSSQRDMEVPF